jgi:hypothetical protein
MLVYQKFCENIKDWIENNIKKVGLRIMIKISNQKFKRLKHKENYKE